MSNFVTEYLSGLETHLVQSRSAYFAENRDARVQVGIGAEQLCVGAAEDVRDTDVHLSGEQLVLISFHGGKCDPESFDESAMKILNTCYLHTITSIKSRTNYR